MGSRALESKVLTTVEQRVSHGAEGSWRPGVAERQYSNIWNNAGEQSGPSAGGPRGGGGSEGRQSQLTRGKNPAPSRAGRRCLGRPGEHSGRWVCKAEAGRRARWPGFPLWPGSCVNVEGTSGDALFLPQA